MGRLPSSSTGVLEKTGVPLDASGHAKAAAKQERLFKKNLSLGYDYYEYFVYSQCLPAWLLLLLRCIMGSVCVSVFLYITANQQFVNLAPDNSTAFQSENVIIVADNRAESITERPRAFKRHFYLCYLTIWSYLVIAVYFVTAIANTISVWLCKRPWSPTADNSSAMDQQFSLTAAGFKSTESLVSTRGSTDAAAAAAAAAASSGDSACRQVGLKLQWLLCGIAANASVLVSGAYFGVLYPMIQAIDPGQIGAVDLLVHGFNSVFMFLEVVLSGVPVRLVHVLYTALYGLVYTLFSILYWLPDHSNVIYPVLLDWNNAGLTVGVMSIVLLIGFPLIQLFWWFIYLARCFLAGYLLHRGTPRSNGNGVV